MKTTILIGLISILLGLIYFIAPKIYSYLKRPKLIIEIEPKKGINGVQTHLGYSSKNPPGVPVNTPEGISIYKFEWMFDLIIRNNSEVNAFNIKMYQHKNSNSLDFNKEINPNKALLKHESQNVSFTFSKIVETIQRDRASHFPKRPNEFKDLMLLLEYENEFGKKFYSRYYFNTDKTSLKKIQKSELEYWN